MKNKTFSENLKNFLQKNKQKLNSTNLRIAIGNEACDLDSFISSLIVAYLEDVIHVVNMRREVFVAKGELMYVLKMYDIDVNDLIFLERPFKDPKNGSHFVTENMKIPLKDKKIELLLTDHNNPIKELKNYHIHLIIDHHEMEGCIQKADKVYLDVEVGSATTLVSKYYDSRINKKLGCYKMSNEGIDVTKLSNAEISSSEICASIAKMLLISIAVDTHNLKIRTSNFDKIEYRKLLRMAGTNNKEMKKLRDELKKARRNNDDQPTDIILQKDLKIVDENYRFGIATVKYSYKKWVDREGKEGSYDEGKSLQRQLEEFVKNYGFDFFFVNTKLDKSRYIVPINFPFFEELKRMVDMKEKNYKGFKYYEIPLEMSRKVLLPMIKKLLE